MRKIIEKTAILLLVCSCTNIWAQDKGYIFVSGGLCNPTGKFGSTEVNDNRSGLAKQGGFVDLSAGKKVTNVLGVAAMFRFQSNPVSTTEIQQGLNSQIQYEIANGNLPPGTYMSVSAKPWETKLFMVGLYLDAPVTKALVLTPRVLIGLMNVSTPEIMLTLSAPSYQSQKSTIASDNTAAFALGLGIGTRLNITNHVGLTINVDYISAEAKYSSYTQSVSMLTIGGGIGYLF